MRLRMHWMALAALATAVAGCGADTSRTASNTAHVNLSLSQGSLPALAASAVGFSADWEGGPAGLLDPSHVDSLIVTVDSVEVLPDSVLGMEHHGEEWGPEGADSEGVESDQGPLGPGDDGHDGMRDSTMRRDGSPWGERDDDWYHLTLLVSGSGRLDLMHLPTDTANGLHLAVGTVPAGMYRGARLFVSEAKIYFDTTLTSRDSAVTFKPDTGYTVLIPSGEHAGIRTRAGFTIPSGATEVVLVFDVGTMVRHAVALSDGRILIVPVLGGFEHHD